MKKSFTLIEVLIATTIFVIIIGIAMAIIWSVMTPKAKTESLSAIQKSARLMVETMVESVKKANTDTEVWEDGKTRRYINFAVADNNGIPTNNIGYSLKTLFTPEVKDPKRILRVFRVYKWDETLGPPLNMQDIDKLGVPSSNCNPHSDPSNSHNRCVLRMMTVIDTNDDLKFNEDDIKFRDLSSPDVDVTNVTFKSHYWKKEASGSITGNAFAPYVEINIDVQSRYKNNQGNYDKYHLRTMVTPTSMMGADEGNNIVKRAPVGRAYLYFKKDSGEWVNMGEYVESSFDLAYSTSTTNGPDWYGAALWDTYTEVLGVRPYDHETGSDWYHCKNYYSIPSSPQNKASACLSRYTSTMAPNIKDLLLHNDRFKIMVCTAEWCSDNPSDPWFQNYLGTVHLVSGWGTAGVKDHGRFIEATIGGARIGRYMMSYRLYGAHTSIFTKAVSSSQTPYSAAGDYQVGVKDETSTYNITQARTQFESWFSNDKLNLRVINEGLKKDVGPLKLFRGSENDWQYLGKFRQSSAGSRWFACTPIIGPGGCTPIYRYEASISYINKDNNWEHFFTPTADFSPISVRAAVDQLLLQSGNRYLIGY